MSYSMYNNCTTCRNSKEAEISKPQLQNIYSGNPLDLGLAVIGGKGPFILYDTSGNLTLTRGLYQISYSTSSVWTTTPYGTNESIVLLTLNNTLLSDSISNGQIPPQPINIGPVPFKLNLSKTTLVRVNSSSANLKLVNGSTQVMGFENTTLTLLKLD